MKKSRFTDSQIMAILKQHEAGVPVAREHNLSSALIYPPSVSLVVQLAISPEFNQSGAAWSIHATLFRRA